MSKRNVYALMKAGRIYTLEPYMVPGPGFTMKRHPHQRWKGFCNGQPCGIFANKKEFETFVDGEPELPPHSEAAGIAMTAEMYSTMEGNAILHRLTAAIVRQKLAPAREDLRRLVHDRYDFCKLMSELIGRWPTAAEVEDARREAYGT